MPTTERTDLIVYSNRLIAYVDVMGFKELLALTPESKARLQEYYDQIRAHLVHKANAFAEYSAGDDFQSMLVSDAIVMSIKFDGEPAVKLRSAANFFNSVSLMQYLLAISDIWTRGAVSVGELFIDQKSNILVGPAFVRAFDLEKHADFPRIIVDPKVCKDLNYTPLEFIEAIGRENRVAKLLFPPTDGFRLGREMREFDAIQIDWFAHAFGDDNTLIKFFGGVHDRMMGDQKLFQKGRRLGRYLRESWDLYYSDGERQEESRARDIDGQLRLLGY